MALQVHTLVHSSDGKHELYNLAEDSKEINNLIQQRPEFAAQCSAKLKKFLSKGQAETKPSIQTPFSQDEIEQLKALGYIAD